MSESVLYIPASSARGQGSNPGKTVGIAIITIRSRMYKKYINFHLLNIEKTHQSLMCLIIFKAFSKLLYAVNVCIVKPRDVNRCVFQSEYYLECKSSVKSLKYVIFQRY